jgi:hypothetical protein
MGDVLLDAVITTRYACFVVHDTDDRSHGLRGDDDDGLVVETNGGVSILLGDLDSADEVPVRARVVQAPAPEAPGDVVFSERMFLYGTGLVVEGGRSSRDDHELDLGGPGRVDVRVFLDRDVVPPVVTVEIGELEPDPSVLPPVPVARRIAGWWHRRRGDPTPTDSRRRSP